MFEYKRGYTMFSEKFSEKESENFAESTYCTDDSPSFDVKYVVEDTSPEKQTCNQLRAIRSEVAKQLGVEIDGKPCPYKGNCTGTCPKCQQEEEILQEAIEKTDQSSLKTKLKKIGVGILVGGSLAGAAYLVVDTINDLTYEPVEMHTPSYATNRGGWI